MGQKHVTARIPEEMYQAIERIREEEHTDRSTAIKILLERGIDEWRLDDAVAQYRDGEASLGAAADRAGLSIWRFLEVLDDREIPVNYSVDDLEADIAAVQNE